MPRKANVAQADISRAVKALRSIGVENMRVKFEADGSVVVEPCQIEGGNDKHTVRLESKRRSAL